MNTVWLSTTDSPAGPLHIALNEGGEVIGIAFGHGASESAFASSYASRFKVRWDSVAGKPVVDQIGEYSTHTRTTFDVPLAYSGSEWEIQVWNVLRTIPYGETRSYGQIATQLGDPSKARAVGWANHVNPIPLIIPCHRVIGAQGNLTGFGGGIDAKIQLLAHEGAMLPGFA